MAYHYDSMNRSDSKNLWMKSVTAKLNENSQKNYPIRTISEISKASLIKMNGNKWRVIKAKGSDINNEFIIKAKIAHQLP